MERYSTKRLLRSMEFCVPPLAYLEIPERRTIFQKTTGSERSLLLMYQKYDVSL